MFLDLGQWLVGMVLGQQRQQGTADQSDVGQQRGVAAAGGVLAQEHVAPPMVAHFHSAPVPANEFEPAFVGVFFGQGTRQVVAAFGAGLPGLLIVRTLRTTIRLRAKGKSAVRGSMAKAWTERSSTRPCPLPVWTKRGFPPTHRMPALV
jgi:hypothetical protein